MATARQYITVVNGWGDKTRIPKDELEEYRKMLEFGRKGMLEHGVTDKKLLSFHDIVEIIEE